MSVTEHDLSDLHPYDTLPASQLSAIARRVQTLEKAGGAMIYAVGDRLTGLYTVAQGEVEVRDANDTVISILGRGHHFGERGLLLDGLAKTRARALGDVRLLLLPAADFRRLLNDVAEFADFFGVAKADHEAPPGLSEVAIGDLMTRPLVVCAPNDTVAEVARVMRDRSVSSVLIMTGDRLLGLVTTRDLTGRVLAEGLTGSTPIEAVMTSEPITLTPQALGSDVLNQMLESDIGHLPIVEGGRVVGIVTRTDLTRLQALSSGQLVQEIAKAPDAAAIARVVARIPTLLAQLVGTGHRHQAVSRVITDVADAATRRLLRLAENRLGQPPVPYLWLACGSQGRQEQTGVSDQDNCLFLDDRATPADDGYFAALAEQVCSGLATCGYYLCPGEMMAINRRWRQPLRVWRDYFAGWVRKPDPMAQMLASVMFDLRPIGGRRELFRDLRQETLEMASKNSIFVAHMVSNSLKHTAPLGLFRGFATVRSGEHKNTVDLKLNGVVPIVDLARIYALQGRLEPTGTGARLVAAKDAGVISQSGGRDLIAAYDLIATTRLRHQAAQVRDGLKPDNFMAPSTLSDLDRHHLRDAFVVVKTMQSALGHSRAALS